MWKNLRRKKRLQTILFMKPQAYYLAGNKRKGDNFVTPFSITA